MGRGSVTHRRFSSILSVSFATLLNMFSWLVIDRTYGDTEDAFAPSDWRQPAALSAEFPDPVSTARYNFDAGLLEEALSDLRADPSGRLIIDGQTADTLDRIATWMTAARLSEEDKSRVVTLANAILLSEEMKNDYHELWSLYEQYHDVGLSLTEVEALPKDEGVALKAAQRRIFGPEISAALFARQNALADLLDAQDAIMRSPDLTAAERKEALGRLREDFRQQTDSWDDHP